MSNKATNAVPRELFMYRGLEAAAVGELAAQFRDARPFPFIQIKDFLSLPREEVVGSFPDTEWPGWLRYPDANNYRKMICSDIARIPPALGMLIHDLNSPAFLRFLEQLTGLEALIPDPYLEGGGLHCTGPGGTLNPHSDFHQYERLHLYRRINVLLYMNEEWRQAYGGCLELYGKGGETPAVTVTPEWGTCVIFETNACSVHGFSKPIIEGRWRRSIALYYYTSAETSGFSGGANTHWRTNGKVSGWRQIRLHLHEGLMFGSRCFSYLAHWANPLKESL
jgi:Rps23 Pro-64 3,4-dihydroxylase Tpa1-like proline 4-hydroxylase